MARVLTNSISLSVAVESSTAVLPGAPVWYLLEPNSISDYGAQVKTVSRSPISLNRQNRKGAVIDLDSGAGFECDLTKEVFILFSEGFVFASYSSQVALGSGATRQSLAADDDVAGAGTEGFTHSALTAALTNNALIYTRGFTQSAANGMFAVDGTNSTTTVTDLQGGPFGIIDEVPTVAQNATLERAGHRGAVGDITWVNSTKTLGATALNLTTLGLIVGQQIHVGGLLAANQFAGGVLYGRVKSIAAGAIVLEKTYGTLVANDTGAGKQIDILFGRFLRNVPVGNASFLLRSYQFEATLPNLQNPDGTGDMYEYSLGNLANTMEIKLPLTDKSTVTFGFTGTDTSVPTVTRKTNAATPVANVQSAPFGTTSDIAHLSLANGTTSLTTCFKDLTFKLGNNVSPEKCLGTLGATFMNYGNFDVELDSTVLFTESTIIDAIRNNTTLTMDFLLRNSDGALAIDIPSLTLGDGKLDFPINESVKIKITGKAFIDAVLGTSIGLSIFPAVP